MAISNVLTYPLSDYHCIQSGIAMPSGVADNAIIDCKTSLGGKPASHLSVYSFNGDTTIRLNVVDKVYARQDTNAQWTQFGGAYTKPLLNDTFEQLKDDITIPSGMALHWDNELPINDVKIVAIVNGNKIIFS